LNFIPSKKEVWIGIERFGTARSLIASQITYGIVVGTRKSFSPINHGHCSFSEFAQASFSKETCSLDEMMLRRQGNKKVTKNVSSAGESERRSHRFMHLRAWNLYRLGIVDSAVPPLNICCKKMSSPFKTLHSSE
jgi:hypothetical protein